MAGTAGIRQFLDIGSGLPTQNNTHQATDRGGPTAAPRAGRDRAVSRAAAGGPG